MKNITNFIIIFSFVLFAACGGSTGNNNDETTEKDTTTVADEKISTSDTKEETDKPAENKMVSEVYKLNLITLTDNSKVSLTDYQDKVLFLNFWATWCGPCVAEMPSIASLAKKYEGKKVAFFIISDEAAETVSNFENSKKLGLPFYLQDGQIPAIYMGKYIPRTYIVHGGKVVAEHVGQANWDTPEVGQMIDSLLAN